MRRRTKATLAAIVALATHTGIAHSQESQMSFFVTSVGKGDGANLGGLEGADAHCQSLAQAAGAGSRTWRAYLSTSGEGAVNARDRIGAGPWVNTKGVQIAANVDELHSDANKINKETALDERGNTVKGRGDEPNEHDILNPARRHGISCRRGHDLFQLDLEQ
jgi:hypothetical protein